MTSNDPSSSSFSYETSPHLYLFTSLTAGSSHIITATSRLETILKANRIVFRAIDCATDEKARRLWGRRSGGKKLPGLVKEGMVLGDLETVEEWNEFGEIKQKISGTTVPEVNTLRPQAQTLATKPTSSNPIPPLAGREQPAAPPPTPVSFDPTAQQASLAAQAASIAAIRNKVPNPKPILDPAKIRPLPPDFQPPATTIDSSSTQASALSTILSSQSVPPTTPPHLPTSHKAPLSPSGDTAHLSDDPLSSSPITANATMALPPLTMPTSTAALSEESASLPSAPPNTAVQRFADQSMYGAQPIHGEEKTKVDSKTDRLSDRAGEALPAGAARKSGVHAVFKGGADTSQHASGGGVVEGHKDNGAEEDRRAETAKSTSFRGSEVRKASAAEIRAVEEENAIPEEPEEDEVPEPAAKLGEHGGVAVGGKGTGAAGDAAAAEISVGD